MSSPEPNGSGVGLTVRELVLEIREDVKDLTQKVETIEVAKTTLEDHEQRLRNVESWKSKIPVVGVLAAIAVIVEVHSKFVA